MHDVWAVHDFIPDVDLESLPGFSWHLARKLGVNIPGGPSGCGFYRIVQPLDALRDVLGWDTGYRAGMPIGEPEREKIAKIIVTQRTDKGEALPYWRRYAARHRLVYEIDDNVFEVDITNWVAYQAYQTSEVRDAVEQASAVADLVTVTTEPLAEVMRKFNPEVRVVPNVVPDFAVEIDRCRQPKVVIGWQGGASHAKDVAMIAGTVRNVLDKHRKRAELHVMGTDYRPTIGREGRFTQWIPIAKDSRRYFSAIDFDIGLAPLTGGKFDECKSAIKAIEYNALGIPVIASDVTPYRDFIVDGVNGYLCRKKGDWGRRLEELICDDAARTEMGARGREIVAANHTMSTGVKRWASVYEELM